MEEEEDEDEGLEDDDGEDCKLSTPLISTFSSFFLKIHSLISIALPHLDEEGDLLDKNNEYLEMISKSRVSFISISI